MFYSRLIYKQILKELKSDKIIVLTGMRHTGKTTIINQVFGKIKSKNKTILDFGNPLHRKVFEEENFDDIWYNLAEFGITKEKKAFIFIDEFQNLPQSSESVKYLFDHYAAKFFLTGSSSFYLKNLFPESMANRKFIFELHPLTFGEFLIFKNTTRNFHAGWPEKAKRKNRIAHGKLAAAYKEYMEFGGFPEVVLEPNRERKKMLLKEVFTSYFEQDVKSLADFKDLAKIRDMILLLAARTSSKLGVAKLSSELSLSRETVYNYLEFLQKSYFVRLIPKFAGNVDRQVAGGKKVYLCDTGLTNYLSQINAGQLFEASVFQNLNPIGENISYFDSDGRSEIDFVVDSKLGLEVKTSVSPKEVFDFSQRLKKAKLKRGFLISLEWSAKNEVILAIDL